MKEKQSQKMRFGSVFVFDGVVSMWMTRELDKSFRSSVRDARPFVLPGPYYL